MSQGKFPFTALENQTSGHVRDKDPVPSPPEVPSVTARPEATPHPIVACPPRAAASYCKNGGVWRTPAEHGGLSGFYFCQ